MLKSADDKEIRTWRIVTMQIASRPPQSNIRLTNFKGPDAPDPQDPKDGLHTRRIIGGLAGGTVAGLGLGYLGMELGMRVGLNAAIGTFGPSAAGQIISVFVPGLQYMMLGAAVGGAAGVAAGGALGGYLGCTLAKHHDN